MAASNNRKKPGPKKPAATSAKGGARKAPAGKNVVSSARRSTPGQRGSQQMTIIIVAVLVAIVAIGGGIFAVVKTSNDKAAQAASNDAKSVAALQSGVQSIAAAVPPGLESTVADGVVLVGKPDAAKKVDMWIDLQCPACKAFEAADGAVLEQAATSGKAQLRIHPVAILNEMSQGTNYSSRAGNAVLCGADQGKYWAYAKALYVYQPAENTSGLPDDRVVLIGQAAGLDGTALKQCIDGQANKAKVDANTKQFTDNKYQVTPTVLVDNQPTDPNQLGNADYFKSLLGL